MTPVVLIRGVEVADGSQSRSGGVWSPARFPKVGHGYCNVLGLQAALQRAGMSKLVYLLFMSKALLHSIGKPSRRPFFSSQVPRGTNWPAAFPWLTWQCGPSSPPRPTCHDVRPFMSCLPRGLTHILIGRHNQAECVLASSEKEPHPNSVGFETLVSALAPSSRGLPRPWCYPQDTPSGSQQGVTTQFGGDLVIGILCVPNFCPREWFFFSGALAESDARVEGIECTSPGSEPINTLYAAPAPSPIT